VGRTAPPTVTTCLHTWLAPARGFATVARETARPASNKVAFWASLRYNVISITRGDAMADGRVSATWVAAALRGVGVALLAFVGTYATTITTVDDDCGVSDPPATVNCEPGDMTQEQKAMWPALAAAATALGWRGLVEGGLDASRQKSGNVKPSDVQPNS
jgi:hypothetical protein